MESLEKCPFCGDEAEQTYSNGRYGAFGWIECSLCGAKTKSVKIMEPSRYQTEYAFWQQQAWRKVIQLWNRRRGTNNS